MVKTIAPDDIRDLLGGFAAAIELDQLRVDALPLEKFHPWYSDSMWRAWRRDHITYINNLLTTVSAVSPAVLEELTQIAITCEPAVVGQIAIDLFAERASESCLQENLDTAALFFRWLIEQVGDRSCEGKPIDRDPRPFMFRWLPVTDPLRIAQDPECAYGQPAGFVS
ncbi:hypothetical protein QA640_18150 [Bradyrhizobium sp. CB82]|uniref:hypothetical protein n=1 Tax=Bradyrhizobium sp. CB82 TaxID=3039159 RepID=UPI0024B27473|nr:hypothetical protein [Bradyrhizobium sp. CB82]WFU44196.1 hypothetical protein QA640_18150 [Bradyrhizobium sp. CB82]